MPEPEAFCDEIVRLGYLRTSVAERARAAWAEAGLSMPFDEFLVDQGLLSSEQRLAALAAPTRSDVGADAVEDEWPEPRPGDVHSGCVVERKLGQGGMGAVFLAQRRADGQRVVLKFLASSLAGNASLRARFRREGELLARLDPHPNLVRVFAVDDGARPHIVMELVEGAGLDVALAERFSLPPPEGARVARDVARGLAAIHARGIIHRDVKPANIVVGPDGTAKLIDFGLAKDLRTDDGITRPGMRLGTPYYMAPEQWGNHVVDERCDLFALGATLYHLIVGEPPFLGRDAKAISRKILAGEYTPPRRVVPAVSEDLEHVISQLLQVDRSHRYREAEATAQDLDRVLRGEQVPVPRLLELRGDVKRRHVLLPGRTFTIGRGDDNDIVLRHPSVSTRHAVLRREPRGFVLEDAQSTFGSFVGEQRLTREVVLRDGDALRLGRVDLEFHDDGAARPGAATTRMRAEHPTVVARLVEPALEALAWAGDPAVALLLLERLAAPQAMTPTEHLALGGLVGDEASQEVARRVAGLRADARAWALARLQAVTGEAHGLDLGPWLAWWDEQRRALPPQVGAHGPVSRVGLALGEGLPGSPTTWLPADPVITIGRSESCGVQLSHQSVSRHHATLYRLPERVVLRDEGSRFGTLVNGGRVERALLARGDRIEVGNVTLTVLEEPPPVPRTTLGTHGVDARTFEALCALEHPSVALALARFLHQEQRLDWLEDELARAHPGRAVAPEALERAQRAYVEQAARARALLPRVLGLGPEAAGTWRKALAERRKDLPPQVMPLGWFFEPTET